MNGGFTESRVTHRDDTSSQRLERAELCGLERASISECLFDGSRLTTAECQKRLNNIGVPALGIYHETASVALDWCCQTCQFILGSSSSFSRTTRSRFLWPFYMPVLTVNYNGTASSSL